MFDNSQKIWMGRSLNQLALNKALEVIHQQGRALPCSVTAVSGSIVTVKFEVNSGKYTLPQVTVPVAGPEYIRCPTQVGDKGIVLPADTYIGNVTGLGGGTPSLSLPGNLSALVFFPVGNKNWSAPDDPNAVCIYGPNGAVIRDAAKTVTLVIKNGAATLTGNLIVNGNFQLSGTIEAVGGGTYAGTIQTSGGITAGVGGDSVTLQHHTHEGVTAGGASTDPPTSGT